MCFSIQLRRSFVLCIATCTFGSTASAIAAPHTIQTFEAPGAGKSGATQQGTLGLVINDFGVIAGITRDANDVRHGFLRHPDGTFTVFDCPGAGTGFKQGTQVLGLNAIGAVAGTCRDANDRDRPYIRDANGTFTTINLSNLLGGNAWAINLGGTVVGNFLNLTDDQSLLTHYHGFIRAPNGVITLFDPPGSVMTEIPGAAAINDAGAITGDYWVCSTDLSTCSIHGFVRTPKGKYLVVDVPGAGPDGNSFQGTFPQGINDLGEVSGQYVDANSVVHGFVRSASGSITSFDVPTTCTVAAPPADCAFEGTWAGGINLVGTVVGVYFGEDGVPHGFWRAANGSITTFDVQRRGYLTDPISLNDFGQITGIAFDARFVTHGLLVTP
jgi:hypothetical protein